MIRRVTTALCCALFALAGPVLPVAAQTQAQGQGEAGTMTEAEISEAFARQKTRGLSIAPVGQGNAPAAASDPATSTTTVQPETQVAFDAVPKDEQVNINIAFDFDSAALREDQKPKLVALCNVMKTVDVQVFRILGHTDASGSADYNERLSRLRAEEVKRHLVSDCGIAPERLEAQGVGERFPFDPADPRADINRRVEFQVLS